MHFPDGVKIKTEGFAETLEWTEYLVLGAVLIISLGIGVFFGYFGNKHETNEEFLMAGHSMSILPVSCSLVCSFVSAVTILGNPVEVYFYGQQYTILALSFIPTTIALAYFYVPVYFDLRLTSANQFLEWRFSRGARVTCSVLAIVHLMIYIPIVVLGPSLAIDQVAGFDYRVSFDGILAVCIAYSSMGGLKAVLWTDTLQAGVMFVSLLAICICGAIEVGGLQRAWEISADSDRTSFFNFDPDPRTRHTFWTGLVGGFMVWLPIFAATQAQIQRYNSVLTLKHARMCLFINMIGMMVVILLCSFLGMLIYAKYHDCDPVNSHIVSSPDQLLPLFVVDALSDYYMLPGLLIAGITCASLSTVSSAINAITVMLVEDFLKPCRPMWNDAKLGHSSRLVSTVVGIITVFLVYSVKIINDSIQISPFSTLIHGSLLGPILGTFSLGLFFPWTNNLGMLMGILCSIICSMFYGVGNIYAANSDQLPNMRLNLTLRSCPCMNETYASNCTAFFSPENYTQLDFPYNKEWKNDTKNDSFLLKSWSVSYIWEPGIGVVTTMIFGIFFSLLLYPFKKKKYYRKKVQVRLLNQSFVRLWNAIFGIEEMRNWIDYDNSDLICRTEYHTKL